MATYTMTLRELETIQGMNLFEPHDYVDYPHVVSLIRDEFGEQEIAFPAPDMFKRKLNHQLGLLCGNYNKMLRSQLIEIDPFVTEYIMTEGRDSTRSHEGEHRDTENTLNRDVNMDTATKSTGNETYAGATSGEHSKQNADTEVKGILRSEAENIDKETTRDLSTNTNEKTNYSESVVEDNHKEVTGTSEKQTTDNQTGRQWTEKGNSQGHNLDVHSDMPQNLLFNNPNALYGTGREHAEGRILTDAEGNQYVADFPETDPNTFDTATLEPQSASEDSPWYNYATTADNKTGHDTYNKEGTETYQKSGSDNTSTTEDTQENNQKDTDGNKTVDTTHTEDETTHEASGRALNTNEHSKGDAYHDEAYKEQGTDNHTTDSTSDSRTFASTGSKQDVFEREHRHVNRADDRDTHSTMKGRRMASPSKLLAEYRTTLTFNCDLWLLGELEPLFMQLF